MTDLAALAAAPLADPLHINLPEGRRPNRRGPKPVYEGEFAPPALTKKQVRDRADAADRAKFSTVLDYYAGTSVPIERIAAHTGLTVEQAATAMQRRGRAI